MINDLTMEVMDEYYRGETLPQWARGIVAKFLVKQRAMLREFNLRATEEARNDEEVLPF